MMQLRDFLKDITAREGLSGDEGAVAARIAQAFEPYVDKVRITPLYDVIATVGTKGPKVMIAAHEDEIGLMALDIEDDGSIRVARVGGVDPRILPAAEVRVMAKDGPLFGVIGAKPPHLLTDADRKKSPKIENMYVDTGFDAETVRKLVRPGDRIALTGSATELKNNVMASKTMDDRACVGAMLEAAKWLGRMNVSSRVQFVATSQEEVGSYGAMTACWAGEPDYAIALDVTHAEMPGCEKWEVHPIDKLAICTGPNINPELERRIRKTAEINRVEYSVEASSGTTYTDADPMQISREGVPTALISVPVRYMHTTVETLDTGVIEEAGRLLALAIRDIADEREAIKWY
ncbi:MAG: M20/M25/M40 family metallo-hydrolase [Clostridia bacterium]|nr:M20/M25/M40 family metallo-hydrolase [Clostridia bacterium]